MTRHLRVKSLMLFTILLFLSAFSLEAYAGTTTMYVKGASYEIDDALSFSTSNIKTKDTLIYGRQSLGKLSITGDICENGKYNDVNAYSVNDVISFSYSYDGSMNKREDEEWQICSSDEKEVNGIALSKKIQDGVIIVQKSSDGKNWESATEEIYDAFGKANTDKEKDKIYTTTTSEIMSGTYYRIVVAYRMERQTIPGGFMKKATYDYRNFVEEYTFFVCTDKNYVRIRDVNTKESISNGSKISNGFYIDKSGSADSVTVKLNNGVAKVANQYESFTEPGEYYVEITTKLNKKYYYKVTVEAGYSYYSFNPIVFESEKNKGFEETTRIQGNTSAGISSLTSLKIAQNAGYNTTKSTYNGFDAYGINGDSVALMLHFNYSEELQGNGWLVEYDKYGAKDKELVCGCKTGEVGKGAVIIQTSTTGKDGSWIDENRGKYAEGLYNTDFSGGFSLDAKEDILLYTPAGVDKGLYIRVIYVYQVHNASEKKYVDCKEKYEFYLCSSELGAVQFHNLSLSKDSFEKTYGDADANQLALLKNAESLASNTGTTTGFSIDTSKNPTVDVKVDKNGTPVSMPSNKTFSETGRYDIHLTSKVGTKQDVTIYVDKLSDEDAKKLYFGDGFIQGKRIYAEEDYPTYEGGESSYNLEAVSDIYLPISGVITNNSTGKDIQIESSRNARKQVLTTPGNYTAVFRTGFDGSGSIGDVREFTFNFTIIPQGTAPGPRNNQELLETYSHTNISDSYPIYYGVKYQSASSLPITVAFKDKASAIDFAYNYEKGYPIEKLSDGSYKYNGSFLGVEDSIVLDDEDIGDDIPKILYKFVEDAVHMYYFDLSDDSTYITLKDSDIEKVDTPRQYSLNRSAVIFNPGEKALLTDLDSLPIISRKPYAYINPGKNGVLEPGYNDFEFIRDTYGCDSDSVVIKDCNGKEYSIKYGGDKTKSNGVGKQLQEYGCATGKVTITETTAWGDSVSYEAVFINEGDNTTKVNLTYYANGSEQKKSFTSTDDGAKISVDAFSIESVSDDLDPYALIIVSKDGQRIDMYAADQFTKGAWSEAGEYNIRVVNRLGFGYSFNIVVSDTKYSIVSFEGDGTENVKDIITEFGAEKVELPKIEMRGYKLIGFEDENKNIYNETIDKIKFKGTLNLRPVWEAASINVIVKDLDGREISKDTVEYGAIFELPTITVDDSKEFIGWMCDGQIYKKTVEIKSEKDMIFTPAVKDIETGDIETGDGETATSEKSKAPKVIIWILIIGLLSGGGYLFMRKRKEMLNKTSDKENGEDTCEEDVESKTE